MLDSVGRAARPRGAGGFLGPGPGGEAGTEPSEDAGQQQDEGPGQGTLLPAWTSRR